MLVYTLSVLASLSTALLYWSKWQVETSRRLTLTSTRSHSNAASNVTLPIHGFFVVIVTLLAPVASIAQGRGDGIAAPIPVPSFTDVRDTAIAEGTDVPSVAKPIDNPTAAAAPEPELGRTDSDMDASRPSPPEQQPGDQANAVNPAPEYYDLIQLHGRGNLAPFYDIVVAEAPFTTSDDRWRKAGLYFQGPRGFKYRQFVHKKTGWCLDVKGGATTAMAELTLSSCDYWKNSQWWTTANDNLMPWHAADQDLVATWFIPGGWNFNRVVLAPRFGPYGHADQVVSIGAGVIPH